MARSIDESFYKGSAWEHVRDTYKREHPLCEVCLAKGKYNPTEIVHHKIHLTKKNYLDPKISLNPDNLQALCKTCHNRIHFGSNKKNCRVLPDGTIEAYHFLEDGSFEVITIPPET